MWERKLGEIIRWMISAIQEVPWLSFEPKVSKLPSSRNTIVSRTFFTAESFSPCFKNTKNIELFLFIEQPLGFMEKENLSISQNQLAWAGFLTNIFYYQSNLKDS